MIIHLELNHIALALVVSYFVFSSCSRSKSGAECTRSKSRGWASCLVFPGCRIYSGASPLSSRYAKAVQATLMGLTSKSLPNDDI